MFRSKAHYTSSRVESSSEDEISDALILGSGGMAEGIYSPHGLLTTFTSHGIDKITTHQSPQCSFISGRETLAICLGKVTVWHIHK